MNRVIATVAVENTFFNFDSDYDYYVPKALEKSVKIGTMVKVPFGKGDKKRDGIVLKVFTAINSSYPQHLNKMLKIS